MIIFRITPLLQKIFVTVDLNDVYLDNGKRMPYNRKTTHSLTHFRVHNACHPCIIFGYSVARLPLHLFLIFFLQHFLLCSPYHSSRADCGSSSASLHGIRVYMDVEVCQCGMHYYDRSPAAKCACKRIRKTQRKFPLFSFEECIYISRLFL